MKRVLFLICLFLGVLAANCHYAHAQGICPADQVCIDHATANKLFNTVDQLIAAKDTINKMLAERNASDVVVAQAQKVIQGYADLEVINGRIQASYQQVLELYQATIKLYADLVQKLTDQLNKPKSAWQKFVQVVEKIAVLAAGIAIGRGF